MEFKSAAKMHKYLHLDLVLSGQPRKTVEIATFQSPIWLEAINTCIPAAVQSSGNAPQQTKVGPAVCSLESFSIHKDTGQLWW